VSSVRELFGRIAAKRERDREDVRRDAARARFWADHRQGQREADAHGSRRDS
jgi:hypothetical protein